MNYGKSLILLLLLCLGAVGCAADNKGTFKRVAFPAPSRPFAALRPLLKDAEVFGVLSATNIEPVRQLDIEKVMGRLTDAVANALGDMPDMRVVSQDEIRWHFKDTVFDSSRVFAPGMRQALREELEVDVLVYIELKQLQTLVTGNTSGYLDEPSPYDNRSRNRNRNNTNRSSGTGLDLTVDIELIVSNLHSGAIWRQQGEQKSWQPVQLQFMGDDQTERQLMTALSSPLRRFIYYISPPPSRQVREFETSGD